MSHPKTPLQILTEARVLIGDESRWTRFDGARNADGVPVEPSNRDAVCFCSLGALERAAGSQDSSELTAAGNYLRDAAKDIFGDSSIISANDRRPEGHRGVIKLFDSAIAQATLAEQARAVSP